jgi:hypothetical protein
VATLLGIFFAVGYTVAQQNVTEQTVALERFGFRAGSCVYRQSVQFLDDDHLLLSAPLVSVCDKTNWSSALRTQFTVIDLHGTVMATKTRPDVYTVEAGPIGYTVVCTENTLELVSGDLSIERVISSRPSKFNPCSNIDGLSPSRTAISVRDFGESPKSFARHRLIDARKDQPIAEQQFGNGDSLAGITDSGYAVCTSTGHHGCEQLVVNGNSWVAGTAEVAAHPGLFLSPDQLLLPPAHWRSQKALMSLSPNGKEEQVVNLRGFQPPNFDSEEVNISATTPRRILYSATGCYIGDFDDCYGFIFKRVVVFDPQASKPLLNRRVWQYAIAALSPNGHAVVILDRTKLHIFMIP